MRAAAMVVALAVTLAGPARADGEGAVDLDLDAFADHLADALTSDDDDVAVDAWEERLEPQAEDDWVAARGAREPEVDHPASPTRAATVGLTVNVGDVAAVTRLVFADAARSAAFFRRVLLGDVNLPLGAGPSGRALPSGPVLLEPRGRDLLIIRAHAGVGLDGLLSTRAALWAAPGVPAPASGPEELAVIDRGLVVLACVENRRLSDLASAPVRDGAPKDVIVVAGKAAYRCETGREAEARALAVRIADALGVKAAFERTD